MDKIKAEQEALIVTKRGIEKEIQEAGEHHIDAEYIDRFCYNISTVLDKLSFEEKRMILREVIEKIVVKDNEVSIFGIIPLQEEIDGTENASIASMVSLEQDFSLQLICLF